jgi:cell division protein FtsB
MILVLAALYLQYLLWFGQGGIRDVARLKESLSTQTDQMTRLSERNRALAIEVMDLKKGLEAIEERARTEMGMIKQGETFYQVVERPENGSRVVKNPASVPNRE